MSQGSKHSDHLSMNVGIILKWVPILALFLTSYLMQTASANGGTPSVGNSSGGTTAPFGASVGTQVAPVSSGVSTAVGNTPEERMANALLDPNYKKCGFDCHYQRANETISLQVDFILKKRDFLQSPKIQKQAKKDLLVGFCGNVVIAPPATPSATPATPGGAPTVPDPTLASKKEKLDDCIERYMKFTALWLMKARGALGKNEGTMANLGCAKWDSSGKCIEASNAPHVIFEEELQKLENQKKVQAPYFIKASEIAAIREREKLQYHPIDNKTWYETMRKEFEPNIHDFVRFKKILRDPSNPGSGTFEVPAKKPDGSLDYDEVAFKRAHQAWKDSVPSYLMPTITGRNINDTVKQNQEETIKSFKDPSKTTSDYNRYLFNEVQGEAVHFTSEIAKPQNGWGKKEMNFPGKTDPAAAASGAPSADATKQKITLQRPEGGYSGNESVVLPPSNDGANHQYYFRFTGSQIGVHSDEATSPKPHVKVADPAHPDPKTGAPSKRNPTSNTDGTYSDTQSVIDLYF